MSTKFKSKYEDADLLDRKLEQLRISIYGAEMIVSEYESGTIGKLDGLHYTFEEFEQALKCYIAKN